MSLPEDEITRCRRAGVRLGREWGVFDADAAWAALRWGPEHDALPTVHLEDVSAIPFVSGVPGVEEYQHRARVRAGDGDLFVGATPPADGYEDYCRDHLGIGAPHFVLAETPAGGDVCAVADAASVGPAFDAIVQAARDAGGIGFHPYMAIRDVWNLAEQVAATASVPVGVLGPTPAVLWIANDKARFSETVARTAGTEHLVETLVCTGVGDLVTALLDLAERYDRVGIKRTRCASAMGNRVVDASEIRQLGAAGVTDLVTRFLADTEWRGDEEILAVEWATTELSPSTQLWLPLHGPPVCEGIYEQLLEGEERCFLGSRPSTLPAALNAELERIALQVGAALQAMGYVGRCSFDFVVTGDPEGAFSAKFIECNGRWGGTSTPMHLVDRLLPDVPRPAYVAQDWMDPRLEGWSFHQLRAALADDLFDPRTGDGRFILYNVGPLVGRGKFDVIGLGADPEDAWRGVRERLPERLEAALRGA